MPKSEVFCMDCLEAMRKMPDNAFDLAVVDPPYGDALGERETTTGTDSDSDLTDTRISTVNRGGGGTASRSITSGRHGQGKNCRRPGGTWSYPNWWNVGDEVCKKIIAWDVAPGQEYFDELFRISRSQIIWGGNYFNLPPTRCFLVWRKLTISEAFSMAMAEYAWTSFNSNAKVFEAAPQGKPGDRFHPTQKPIELYEWLLKLFAKPGDTILDTHMGSQSSRIAAWNLGFDYTGYEIDETYFKLGNERFERHSAQMNLFNMEGL